MTDKRGETYATRPLSPDTWDDFAALVEANNGVWGGCWCMGFHPEGVGQGRTVAGNREAKRGHVTRGTVHQMLVYDGDECVGWCQFGPPGGAAQHQEPQGLRPGGSSTLPDWRIGCIFTGKGHRGKGVARAAVAAALDAIKAAGGGSSRPTRSRSRTGRPQRGAYFHTGPEKLFEDFGFTRDRRIAKWRWVMRLTLSLRRPAAPIRPAPLRARACQERMVR